MFKLFRQLKGGAKKVDVFKLRNTNEAQVVNGHLVPMFYKRKLLLKPKPLPPRLLKPEDLCMSNLRGNPGWKPKKQRLGRGASSGRGRASGRGQKTSIAHRHRGFEGNQMPLYRQLPKVSRTEVAWEDWMKPVSLGDLQAAIDTGRLNPNVTITPRLLVDCKVLGTTPRWPGVRLTADGYDWFKAKLDIKLNWCDPDACTVVEANGGTVESVYQNFKHYWAEMCPHKYEPGTEPENTLPPINLWRKYTRESIRGSLVGKAEMIQNAIREANFQWTPELKELYDRMLKEELQKQEEARVSKEKEAWRKEKLKELDELERRKALEDAADQEEGQKALEGAADQEVNGIDSSKEDPTP